MKNLFNLAIAAALVVGMASCSNQNPASTNAATESEESANSGLKIAYVEIDSLMTQYNFAKDMTEELQKKSNNARNTLTQKGNQLQAAANNFQQKLQNNGFTSREQAEGVQAALQRQQNDLAALQARLESELANETQKFNEALHDSLNNFLQVYNVDKKYDMILAKSGDNILLARKQFDITSDIINGLNKRYKAVAKAAPAAAKDKEKAADEKK